MINDKYIAIFNQYAGQDSDSAFCTILAKKISNSADGYILEEENLLQEFYGSKEIFVPRLRQYRFNEGDLLCFTEKEIIPEAGRNPKFHFLGVEKYSAPICIELDKIDGDNEFLNIESLQETIVSMYTASESYFYVTDGIYIYGDFRIVGNKIEARYGVNINRYLSVDCLKIEHPNTDHTDISLLLYLPDNNSKKIDCSTNIQLIERLKHIISSSKITDETRRYINHIKTLITNEDLNDIELAKIRKVQSLFEKVSLKYNEFETLRNNTEFWSAVFNNSIKELEDRLTKEFFEKNKIILDLEIKKESEKLDSIQQRITDGESRLEEITAVKLKETEILETLKNQISLLEHKKDVIILSLQVQARIGNVAIKESQATFEIQQSLNRSNVFYHRFHDFLDDLFDIIGLEDKAEDDLHRVIKQLKDGNFFRCDNIVNFITIINIIGNSQIYLNNAEVDWIKFEKFQNQGLLEAFNYAHSNYSQSVFYLLQDFNIASPECYAKPLIDLSRKIRKTFPLDGREWPTNLRVVFFPLELEIQDFGFEVNDETFSTWEKLDIPLFDCNDMILPMALNLETA
ncbi:hypothetical protein [Sphingobacterium multivorum]|uniref:hypothetical protein n=1 Tax=Sphingobacterium multivorum TaxID=28454 RepID=UPI00345E24C1